MRARTQALVLLALEKFHFQAQEKLSPMESVRKFFEVLSRAPGTFAWGRIEFTLARTPQEHMEKHAERHLPDIDSLRRALPVTRTRRM